MYIKSNFSVNSFPDASIAAEVIPGHKGLDLTVLPFYIVHIQDLYHFRGYAVDLSFSFDTTVNDTESRLSKNVHNLNGLINLLVKGGLSQRQLQHKAQVNPAASKEKSKTLKRAEVDESRAGRCRFIQSRP